MGNIIQNAVVIVGFLLIAGVGYYLYLQQGELLLDTTNEQLTLQLERDAQTFIARQNELRQIDLQLDLFTDARFESLLSFDRPVPTLPIGRDNPFQPVSGVVTPISTN
ncbi:MAG: hypothetical protein AAGA35_00780 [Patescibacteria group bacterium]